LLRVLFPLPLGPHSAVSPGGKAADTFRKASTAAGAFGWPNKADHRPCLAGKLFDSPRAPDTECPGASWGQLKKRKRRRVHSVGIHDVIQYPLYVTSEGE